MAQLADTSLRYLEMGMAVRAHGGGAGGIGQALKDTEGDAEEGSEVSFILFFGL